MTAAESSGAARARWDGSHRPAPAIAEQALELARSAAPGAEVEVAVDRHRVALTRFANSVIHQNVGDETRSVRVRIHLDGRTAAGSATVVGEHGLRSLVERTADAVRLAPRDPGWPGLAPPAGPSDVAVLDRTTADATPDDRAERVRAFVDAAGGLETAGYCRTHHWSGVFLNSAGQLITGESADVGMAGIARRPGSDGAARAASGQLADIDGAALGARAAAKANAGVDPVELPPERHEVVLEPTAVGDILEALSMYGFNAKAVAERRSFVRLGDQQFDPAVTLVDDAPATGAAYDAEGTPRRRLVLVERGMTSALTHDRRTAGEAGTESTGHSVGAPSFGPMARALGLVAADSTASPAPAQIDGPVVDAAAAELVAGVGHGILVTDLWYTRALDPRTLVITGLTRNGVWLIEGGEVTRPLRNLRFTQSYAQALMPGNVLGVGRVAAVLPGDPYGPNVPRWTAPALRLAAWNFTGGASG